MSSPNLTAGLSDRPYHYCNTEIPTTKNLSIPRAKQQTMNPKAKTKQNKTFGSVWMKRMAGWTSCFLSREGVVLNISILKAPNAEHDREQARRNPRV